MSVLQKNKKVAAGIGVAAAAAAVLALGAGTYAAFSDTAVGPGGTLASGTLDLNVTTSPIGATTVFSATNIAPGYTSGPRSVTIANNGNIDGILTGTFEVSGGEDLDDQIEVTGGCQGLPTIPAGTSVAELAGLASGFLGTGAPLDGGQSGTCTFEFTFINNDAINNAAQGETIVVKSNFRLVQATGEVQAD